MNPDCTPLGLIKESLTNREITYHGYNYVQLLTNVILISEKVVTCFFLLTIIHHFKC